MASINSHDIDINHASFRSTVNKRKKHNEFAYNKDKCKKHNHSDQEFRKSKKNIQFHRQSRRDNFVGDCAWDDSEMPSQVVIPSPPAVAPPPPPADVPAYGVSLEPCFSSMMVCENAGRATKDNVELLNERIVLMINRFCELYDVHCGVTFFEELNLWRCTVFDSEMTPRRFEIRVWQRHDGNLSIVVARTNGDDLDGCCANDWRNEKFFRSFCIAFNCKKY